FQFGLLFRLRVRLGLLLSLDPLLFLGLLLGFLLLKSLAREALLLGLGRYALLPLLLASLRVVALLSRRLQHGLVHYDGINGEHDHLRLARPQGQPEEQESGEHRMPRNRPEVERWGCTRGP